MILLARAQPEEAPPQDIVVTAVTFFEIIFYLFLFGKGVRGVSPRVSPEPRMGRRRLSLKTLQDDRYPKYLRSKRTGTAGLRSGP